MKARTLLPFIHAADEAEPGAWYHVFSASQIETFLDCRRKWAWDKIARIPRPENGSAQLGDRVHAQLETYLDGGSFDFTEIVSGRKVAEIAASSVHLLPPPCAPYEPRDCDRCDGSGYSEEPAPYDMCEGCDGTGFHVETELEKRERQARHGMAIEGEFRWQSSSTKFVYVGRKDLFLADSGCIPGLAEENKLPVDEHGRTGVPAILDHKSTSSFQYVKERDVLEWDVQAMLYAYDLIATTGADQADLVWNYMRTRGANDARRVHLRVHRDDAKRKFSLIQDVARDMATIRERAPKFDNSPRDSIEGPPDMGREWRETLAAFVEAISPNPDACEKFGGCSYRHMCGLSPAEGQFRFMSNEKKDDLFDSLRKRAAAQDGVAIADKKPELPPTCAATEVPAPTEIPAWMNKPLAPPGDDLRKPVTTTISPVVATTNTSMTADPSNNPKSVTVEINPPESKLPPPTLPPPVSAPADIPASTTPGETKPKGGRPKGSKNKPKDPVGADAALHTGAPPKPVDANDPNACYAMSNEAAQAAVDRAVATCDDDSAPASPTGLKHPSWLDGGLVLYVDCVPVSHGAEYETIDKYVAKAKERIAAEDFKDADGNTVRYADYRFIPFGKGVGALELAVEEAIDEAQPKALFLSTTTPEGAACLSMLSAKASLVVRGVR